MLSAKESKEMTSKESIIVILKNIKELMIHQAKLGQSAMFVDIQDDFQKEIIELILIWQGYDISIKDNQLLNFLIEWNEVQMNDSGFESKVKLEKIYGADFIKEIVKYIPTKQHIRYYMPKYHTFIIRDILNQIEKEVKQQCIKGENHLNMDITLNNYHLKKRPTDTINTKEKIVHELRKLIDINYRISLKSKKKESELYSNDYYLNDYQDIGDYISEKVSNELKELEYNVEYKNVIIGGIRTKNNKLPYVLSISLSW